MSTLNIRATAILQNPDPDTPILSAISLKSLATIDARYLSFANNQNVESILASGEGVAAIRTFNMLSTTLNKPVFKNDDGNYLYLDNAFIGSQILTANLIPEPLTIVYVAKVFDWAIQKNAQTAVNDGRRMISAGNTSNNAHRIVPSDLGMLLTGSGSGGTTAKQYISEQKAGWFCQLASFNGTTVKYINSAGQLSTGEITASAAIDRIVLGAGSSTSTYGVEKTGLKYASFRSGALTDAELLALHDEVRLMFDL